MATSHDIGSMTNNQVAAFGNMSNYSRSISPMVPSQFAGQMGQGQASFGMMGMTGMAFTPMGPGFAPPGGFPGQGMQRAGMGMAGGAAQAAGAMIPGMATMGLGGGIAAAAMGGPVGMGVAAGMAAGVAGDYMTSMITMSVQNMNATANMMQSQRFQFGRGMGMPGAGAFSAQQVAQVAGGIEQLGMSDVLTSVAEIREITSQLANMGILQVARDVPEIMGRLGETMRAIRKIAVAAQTTMAEAVPILGELRQAGVTNAGMAVGVVGRMAAGQRAGVSMGQQMQAFTAAGQQAMAMGMGGPGAGEAAAQMTRNISRARQTGALSEDDFQRLTMGTGDASIFGMQMQQANLQAVQGPMAIVAGGALGTSALGAAPFGQFLNAAAGNLTDPNAMVSLLNRQDEISTTLASDQFSMVRMARSMAETIPGNRDEMTMLVMQRRFGLGSFQARMMMQQFNSRHQLQLGQTMDDMLQAETNRRNVILREHSPMALINRFGRFTFNALGGREMSAQTRGFMATLGRVGERFARRLTGGAALRGGAGTEEMLAGIISGTADISGLADIERTSGMQAAGGFWQAVGFAGTGRRRGGAIFEEPGVFLGIEGATEGKLGGITETAVESLVEQLRGHRAAAKSGEANTELAKLATKITESEILLSANEDVSERFQELATAEDFKNIPRVRLMAAAVISDNRTARQMLDRADFGKLNLEALQEQLDETTAHMTGILSRTKEVAGPGPTGTKWIQEGLGTKEEARGFINDVMQDPELKNLMMSMASAYSSKDSADHERASGIRQTLQNLAEEKLGKEGAKRVRVVADMFSKDPKAAANFVSTAHTMDAVDKKLKLGTAAQIFGTDIEAKLGTLSDELRKGPLAGMIMDISKALQNTDNLAFRRSHQRLVARAISETEIAQRAGDLERLGEIRQIFEAAGMGSLVAAIDELTPAERGENLAQGIIKTQEESRANLMRKIAGETGRPRGAAGGPEGATQTFHSRLTEHITLLSRSMEAVISGDKALQSKIRKSNAELQGATT